MGDIGNLDQLVRWSGQLLIGADEQLAIEPRKFRVCGPVAHLRMKFPLVDEQVTGLRQAQPAH
jgi:hypothetical protein